MNIEVKGFRSPDFDIDAAGELILVSRGLVEVDVGPVGEESADTFYLELVPEAPGEEISEYGSATRGVHTVPGCFSPGAIRAEICRRIAAVEVASWSGALLELRLWLLWEYDAYDEIS